MGPLGEGSGSAIFAFSVGGRVPFGRGPFRLGGGESQ